MHHFSWLFLLCLIMFFSPIFCLSCIFSLSFRWTYVNPGLFPSIRTSKLKLVRKVTDCMGQRHSGPLWKSFWITYRVRTCAQRTCASSCVAAAHHNPEVPALVLLNQSCDRGPPMQYHWEMQIIHPYIPSHSNIHPSKSNISYIFLSVHSVWPSILTERLIHWSI